MLIKLKLTIFLLFAAIAYTTTFAQNGDTLEIQKSKYNIVKFARFKPDNSGKRKMQNADKFLYKVLNAKTTDELVLVKTFTDDLGISHKTFQQQFKGIPVEGAKYHVHGKGENIEIINGEFIPILLATITPSINETTALDNALKFINAKKYKWQDESLEKLKKKMDKNQNATYYPNSELVISRDVLKTGNVWRLSYKFTISALEPESEQLIYVDALNGDILNKVTLICDVNTPGTAETRYSGTRNIIGDSFAGGFRLQEDRNGVNVQTLNMQRGTNYANAIDFVDNNNNWTAVEHANNNRDQAALDAHWAAESVLDYWRTVHNRNSIDGNGLRVISYVHFDNNWDNAQWDGASNVMRYGDGNLFSPLTSIDVCAHEFGHGIDQFESNLTYQSESGALDEGFSDIWAAVIENWADPAKQRWLIGEEIGGPLRSMANPNLFGQPDTRGGTNWFNVNGCTPVIGNDWCGVHTNSGVLNYCFFLLSEGGNGTNDIGSAFNVTGIGINNAARIAYRAESIYLTSNATFDDARNAFINSARDLFGENSCEFISTMNAWFAVGVGAAYSGNGGLTLTSNNGDNAICNSATYTLNVTAGTNITWTVYPDGIVSRSTSGNTITLTRMGTNSGRVTLTASVGSGCLNGLTTSRKIGVGIPDLAQRFPRQNPRVAPIQYGYYNYATLYRIFTNPMPGSYQTWTVSTDDPYFSWGYGTDDKLSFYFSNVDYTATFYGIETNACGTSYGYIYCKSVASGGSGGGTPLLTAPDQFTFSPNPTTGIAQIASINNTPFSQIRIFDKMGNLRQQFTYPPNTTSTTINISNLTPDTYTVQVVFANSTAAKQFIKQ